MAKHSITETHNAFIKPHFTLFLKRTGTLPAAAVLIALLPAQAGASIVPSVPVDSATIQEVVVTGTRSYTDVRHLPQMLTVVGQEALTQHERQNVLPTLMEQVPGMMVTSRAMMGYGVSTGAAGGMMLRGISSAGGQLMVLIDGHPQYNGVYGHAIADSYQTMMTERVEVLRGPASMLYGSNAMGGVVNIVTRGVKQDTVLTHLNLGAGSYGTVQTEASNLWRKGRFSSTAALNYSRTDNHRPDMGFEQYGGFIKLNYDVTEHWNVFADADVTHFNASYPGTVFQPMSEADQWITRGVATIGVENHYERWNGRFSVYDNFGRHKINDGYAEGQMPQSRLFRSRDALMGVSWFQSANLWSGSRLTIGLDYQNIYGKAYYTSRETGEVLETQNKQSGEEHNDEWAAYVDYRQDLLGWLTFDAGVRYDHHSVTGGEWVPQVGVVARPNATSEVKAMVSKGFRNPTMREMYLYPPSNTDLQPERLWNYELSWRQRLVDERLSYGVNLFHINGDNMIQTVNRKNINTGHLSNNGVEADAQWLINRHWSVNTNHSYLHMKHPVVAAPTYKGYLGANWRNAQWQVSAGLMQVSGLYKAVGDAEQKENFTLLNATVHYSFNPHLSLWVKGDNLLAQHYEMTAGMPMPRATFMAGAHVSF